MVFKHYKDPQKHCMNTIERSPLFLITSLELKIKQKL